MSLGAPGAQTPRSRGRAILVRGVSALAAENRGEGRGHKAGGLGGAVWARVVPVGPGGGRDVYTVTEPRFWPRPALQIGGTLWERLSGSSPRSSWAEVVSLGR